MIEKIIARSEAFLKQKILRRVCDYSEKKANSGNPVRLDGEIGGYSFVVVTDGRSPEIISQCLQSIHKECSKLNYEILLVGPHCKFESYGDIPSETRLIVYRDTKGVAGWISLKKNIGVNAARYENVVVLHDYVRFVEGWADAMVVFDREHPDWDVLLNRITFKDGRRARDWLVWDFPEVGVGLLPYDVEATPYQYISGTFFIAKKSFYMSNPQSEKCRWGEGEDIEWSKRIRKLTTFRLNVDAEVRFIKEKPANDAPYTENWIDNSKKIYHSYGRAA